MDFTHQLITVVLQFLLGLVSAMTLAWFGWRLNKSIRDKDSAKARVSPVSDAPSTTASPSLATSLDLDTDRHLARMSSRLTDLEHQLDRERGEHTEELAARNRLISDLRAELSLARRRHSESATPEQDRAARRSEASTRAVAADDGDGDGGA